MPKQPALTIDQKAFDKALQKVSVEARTQAGRKAIDRAGKSILKASQKKTPVLYGDVRDSHSFESKIDGEVVLGTISVTDAAAFFVHYDLEAKHDDGQALFLTQSMKARRGFMQKAIREELSKVIRDAGLAN
jgi:hypothetical protein